MFAGPHVLDSCSQVYFSGVVVPAVQSSVAELSSASSALLSLIRAVEDSITVVLRKCVDAFMAEVSCLSKHLCALKGCVAKHGAGSRLQ